MKKIKIAHLADVHVRPHKYMDEINFTFSKFLESIRRKDVDLAVICGDFFHSKLTVSSEYFQTSFNFFKELSSICRVVFIPGNHDSVLSNQSRLDAVSPVIDAVNESSNSSSRLIWNLPKSDSLSVVDEVGLNNCPDIVFYHFSIYDQKEKWPKRDLIDPKKINIALYHGCIESCVLDNGWVSRGNRDTISVFDGFDFAFLGDIHKFQFLNNDKTIAYPGSLRQNNFGEDMEKGYLLWTIYDKDDFEVDRIVLPQKRYFITIPLSSISEINQIQNYPKNSRIRVKSLKQFDLAEEIEIKKILIEKFEPHGEIIFVPPDEKIENTNIKVGNLDIIHENIRDAEIQKQLIKEYLKKKNIEDKIIEKIVELDKKYHSYVDSDVLRNVIYDFKNLKFDNMFSYGKDNKIDFSKLNGLIGVFGPNGVGKSSLFDILCFALQNSVFKEGANKNGDYINKKCKKAEVKLEIELNGKNFLIEKEIKKIFTEGKPEAKIENSVNFCTLPKTKDSSLNGETIPDTNKNIKDFFGQKEDLEITSYSPQFNLTSFIDARGTKRKEVFSKFFDLNVFEIKHQKALEDHKEIKVKLKNYNKTQILIDISNLEKDIEKLLNEKELIEKQVLELENSLEEINNSIFKLMEKKTPTENLSKKYSEIQFQDFKNKLKEIEDVSYDSLLVLRKKFEKLNEQNSKFQKSKFQLNVLNKKAELVKKIPNEEVCKKCVLVSDAYESEKEISKIEKEITDLNFDINEFDFIKNEISRQEKMINLKSEILKEINLAENYFKNKSFIEKNEEIDLLIKNSKLEKIKISSSLSSLRERLSAVEQGIGFNLSKIDDFNKKIELEEEYLNQDKIYSLYLDCMNKDGISYWIISKKLNLINKLVNQIISQAVSYKFLVENNDEEKSIKMSVIKSGSKIPIELCSGGEKTIISLALRAALWEISLLPKTPILILDESLSFLDGEKYDSTIKIIKYISSKYFKKIFLITHNEELKGIVDDAIYLSEAKNGFTTMEMSK